MRTSELIKLLQSKCQDDDPIIEFYSYEWTDDLEELDYMPRDFESVSREDGAIIITISR